MKAMVKLLTLFSLVFSAMAAAGQADAGQQAIPANDALATVFTLTPSEMEKYTGDFWEHEEAFAAEIRVLDGRLWAIHSPTRRNELVPAGPDRFEMIGLPSKVTIDYLMDGSGIVEMRRTIDGQPRGLFIPFERRHITVQEVQAYVGDYVNAEVDARYHLVADGLRLIFSRGDESPQELTAMFGDTFEHPDLGSFTFQRDAGGAVTGFLLQSRPLRRLQFERL